MTVPLQISVQWADGLDLPEGAFYMVGNIDDAIKKGEQIAKELAGNN